MVCIHAVERCAQRVILADGVAMPAAEGLLWAPEG
jgi:hypothetical protein